MNWIIASIVASACWGFSYAIYGAKLTQLNSVAYLFWNHIAAVSIFGFVSIVKGQSLKLLLTTNQSVWLVAEILASSVAGICIVIGIQQKSATTASLIEISYPLFVALFSWLIFGDNQLNINTLFGAILMILGGYLIIK